MSVDTIVRIHGHLYIVVWTLVWNVLDYVTFYLSVISSFTLTRVLCNLYLTQLIKLIIMHVC